MNTISIGTEIESRTPHSVVLGNDTIRSLKVGPISFLLYDGGVIFNQKPKLG
jgi:hypothetical protein